MKSKIVEIIIENIEFFGLASESDIHPDVAIRQLEMISTLLKELSASELREFFAQVEDRLDMLRKKGAPPEQLDFLENIRENLGIDVDPGQED